MYKILSIVVLFLTSTGCTMINVKPVELSNNMNMVCIEKNPRVKVNEFITLVRSRFKFYGVDTKIVSKPAPEDCEFVLTYLARNSWDVRRYFSYAKLQIHQGKTMVGSAEYRVGLWLTKWASSKSKIDPVIDRLLEKVNK